MKPSEEVARDEAEDAVMTRHAWREREGFETLIQHDIRFLALQENIASLSKRVLTPEGRRFYDYCAGERDKLRLAGLSRGLGFVVD